MAYKKDNLIITEELYVDPDTRYIYNAATGRVSDDALGIRQYVILRFLVHHPNMYMSRKQIHEELALEVRSVDRENEISPEALKQQINRMKRTLRSISEDPGISSLVTESDDRWMYHQPQAVLEMMPKLNPDYYFSTEKRYLDSDLPRLIGQYDASRTELENTVINRFTMNGETILFLTGEAGIGKSELAITIGRKLAQSYKVARIIYEGSLYDTVMELYPDLNGSSEQTSFEKKISALVQAYDGQFLIIDNFYDPARSFSDMRKDTVFRRLLGSNINLIFVTRYQDTGMFTSYDVPPLPAEEQIRVMRGDGLEEYTDEELAHLCELVGGNTLLCDLVGKMLRNPYNPRSYDEIEKLLSTSTLSDSSLNVFSEKDREYAESPIYQHLKKLCGDIALSENEKYILNAASLLPLDGMDSGAFAQFCGCTVNDLTALHSKGLIKINDAGDVYLHKLYSLYYRDPSCSSDITRTDIRPFLQALCERYNTGVLSDHRLNSSICSVLSSAYEIETYLPYRGFLGIFYACYLGLFGKYREAYETERECLAFCDEMDPVYRAILYKDIAISAGRLDRPDEAVDYLEQAVAILEKQGDRVTLLQAMNSLAFAYGKAGDYEKQRAKAMEALALCDDESLMRNRSRIINDLADSEYHLALYDEAKEHIEEAMRLYGSIGNAQDIWVIQAKRLYANILNAMGHRDKAFITVKRILPFAEQVLDRDHLEILRLYSCLGDFSEEDESKGYYAEVIERAMRNMIALERLEMIREGGRQFIVYISENNTKFKYEVPYNMVDSAPSDDGSGYARVIEYSMEEYRRDHEQDAEDPEETE